MQPPQTAEEGEPLRELIEQCVRSGAAGKKLRPFEVLFAMNAGSYAFNLNVASSDRDYFGIYIAHAEDALSPLTPPPANIDGHAPFDHQIHEAAQYCALLLKGNPKIIEPLFVLHRYYASDTWRDLLALRQHFMTQVTATQYVSYAMSQLGDTEHGKGIETKKFYHCLRLLKEAVTVIGGGHPRVWWDGDDRQFLLDVRGGKYTTEELHKMVQDLRSKLPIDYLDEKSQEAAKEAPGAQLRLQNSLPAKTDTAVIDAWIYRIRCKTLTPLPPQLTLPVRQGSLRAVAEALLTKHNVRGTLLCALPSGSRLHGLATSSSSRDWIGIFALPNEKLCALAAPVKVVDEGGVDTTTNPAYARGGLLLEVNFLCSLIGGNLRLLELLFSDENVLAEEAYTTHAWLSLVEMRSAFVTMATVRSCMGVASSVVENKKAAKEKGEAATGKSEAATDHMPLYHALRLLLEAEHVMKASRPRVHWKGNAELEAARASGAGKELALQKLHALNDAAKSFKGLPTKLAPETVTALNKWAVTIRRELHHTA